MRAKKPNVPKLREQLAEALQREKFGEALSLYEELGLAEPAEPRWPQRQGDLLRRLKHDSAAIKAYEVAVGLYAKQGFVARAAAMAKLILQIDPERLDVLEQVDPDEARRLHRRQRQDVVTALPESVPPARPLASTPPASASMPPPTATAGRPSAPPMPRPSVTPLARVPQLPQRVMAPPPPPPPPPPPAPLVPPATTGATHSDAERSGSARPVRRRKRSSLSFPAVELQPVADGEADELRFADVVEGSAIEIDLSSMELDDSEWMTRTDIDLPSDDVVYFNEDERRVERRRSAMQLAALPSISLFAEVPPAALSRLIQHADLIEIERGTHLMRAGDPADALFVVVSGDLEVYWPGLATPIAIGEGNVVGEACLLDDVTRHADVRAVTRVSALRIPKAVLNDIEAEFPAVGDVLLELLTRRLISNLLRTNALFAGFDAETRSELARLFEVRRATAGTAIFEFGKKTDGLYLPLLGRLEASQGDKPLGRVRLGSVVGQNGMLRRTPAEFSIVAVTDCLVLRLPVARFNELAAHFPMALAHLSELSDAAEGDRVSLLPGPP